MAEIKGLKLFRDHFAGYENQYKLIGGTACHLSLGSAGIDFRATKDLDIVLVAEALTKEFAEKFWQFIEDGGYQNKGKSEGDKQFYRFTKPAQGHYPEMIELLSRDDTLANLAEGSHLTPLPIDESISSLSAILLDEHYYTCIQQGRMQIEGVSILEPEYLLVFKAKAWLDLTERKANGQTVRSNDIKKHKKDVFRLSQLLAESKPYEVHTSIKKDLVRFFKEIKEDGQIDLEQLGIQRMTVNDVELLVKSVFNI
jgi:hypothetical protein